MALTIGTGPFGECPDGRFDVVPPHRPLLFWEPYRKRLRVDAMGGTLVDSRAVVALHETGRMMRLAVPQSDVHRDLLRPGETEDGGRLGPLRCWAAAGRSPVLRAIERPPSGAAELAGLMLVDVGSADTWYLEDEPGYAHPRDPYHRFDVHRSSRRVVVSVGDVVIAESSAPAILFETSMPVRYYLPPDAVSTSLLVRSETVSQCPYKGDGQHWHVETANGRVEDAGWSLAAPMGDALAIPRWFCFYPEKAAVTVDGERL